LTTKNDGESILHKRGKNKRKLITNSIFGFAAMGLMWLMYTASISSTAAAKANHQPLGSFPVTIPTLKFGFALDTFIVHNDTIQANQFLADILLKHHIDYASIDELARNTTEIFDVRGLRANKPFTILSKDTSKAAQYFIYEPSVFSYVVYDLQNKTATKVDHPITTLIKTASGIIESSLWNAMTDNGLSYELASKMEDALAWSIDFHHIQKNDRFKLVFEEQSIDGQAVGIGEVKAAYYKNLDNEYHAIYFENDRHKGFYDLEARSMEKAFLKSPVKYSRISSRFNRNRFHPVLRRRKAHLGTDYAAPHGTPIFAVADGLVTKATRSRGNGNYVKIKHDDVYQTQYLHMSRFGKGIRSGAHVKQGQTIGYVGSTGLATGPHVCFRFWKYGKQVNHLKQNLPPPDPMQKEDIPNFNVVRDAMMAKLDAVLFADEKEKQATDVETKVENDTELTVNKVDPTTTIETAGT